MQPELPVKLCCSSARARSTLGMRFEIAVALLDRDLRVLVIRRMPPWRLLLPRRRVRHVLECRSDVGLRAGDRLRKIRQAEAPSPA